MKLLIFYCNQDIPKANGVNNNANPQRVALKETQDLKVRLQECLQLSSGTSNCANRQHTQGHNLMPNGPQKPTSATHLYPKKDLQGYVPSGKHEYCSQSKKKFMDEQTDSHSSVDKGENKENKENKEKGKSKDAK